MTADHDTIVAPATAPGGAIAVVRVSGARALALCDTLFRGRTPLAEAAGYTVHYGRIADGDRTVDDVLAAVFRAPHSYTGEDAVEISCHGSSYIVSEILRLLIAAGARMASPGESAPTWPASWTSRRRKPSGTSSPPRRRPPTRWPRTRCAAAIRRLSRRCATGCCT